MGCDGCLIDSGRLEKEEPEDRKRPPGKGRQTTQWPWAPQLLQFVYMSRKCPNGHI